MEKKQSEINERFEAILNEPEFFSINGLLKPEALSAMQQAYNLDRESPPVTEQNDINVNLSENIVTTTPLRLKAIDKLGQTFLIAGREEMFCSEEIFVREPSIPDYPVCFNIKLGEIVDPNDVYLDRFCEDENWISAYRLKNKPVSMAVTGTAEEEKQLLIDAQNSIAEQRGLTNQSVIWYLGGAKFGCKWQANRQSTIIERLAKAMEEIVDLDTLLVIKLKIIAREALKSIKH